MYWAIQAFRAVPFEFFESNDPFCLGETRCYLNQCDLFRSFHAIIEVQFGGLAHLDSAANSYRDNLNSLYCHLDLVLTVDQALRNIIMSTYAHYINTWAMNGACVGHCTVLMWSMLMFAMHLGRYWHWECHFAKEHKRKGLPMLMPSPPIDVVALLTN